MEKLLTTYAQKGTLSLENLAKRHTKRSLDAKETGAIHGTWQFENMMLSYIRDGEPEQLRTFLLNSAKERSFVAGTLAEDPLRQAKNLLIGLVAVVGKVAGIGGGMDVEDAYRLIDLYTQECEKCDSTDSVMMLQFNMVMDFAEQVQQSKLPQGLSKEVFDAIQFIANNTTQNIGLDDVAMRVGISRSYLTRRFRAETGKSINETITDMKLRDAKRLLRYSNMTLSEIASYLSFSSQSYFQTIFKKHTGLSPTEYRRHHTVNG